ncbi:armadillo repeat-containing protein 7-like isoform X2 [Patiria miniata]|uniref:Armadillo repeat-containing protein 7 n=1 Tax=Patiria miniata TaxID=46514 RepID=A0A913ZDK9_PATMI|nr:armadillo repeat-containing protein 7-like isoform X2 [Patiria miniata]
MFSSQRHLDARTPADGVGRLAFLQQLVTEFQTSTDDGAKEQVLANLANFAYDPINYNYLRELNVIDLFLDRSNKDYIISCGGVKLIIDVLSRPEEETVLSAITALMFLTTPQSKTEITAPSVVECMHRFAQSTSRRLSNLASVFLQDYCTDAQRQQAAESSGCGDSHIVGIPLPSSDNPSSADA